MFSLREFELSSPPPQDIYCQQWIKHRREFATELGQIYDQVMKDQSQIERFEIIQEANMGGTYRRCFYKLQGDETIYGDVAFEQPYLKIESPDYKWIVKSRDAEFWEIVKQQFTITKGINRFILVFTRKSDQVV